MRNVTIEIQTAENTYQALDMYEGATITLNCISNLLSSVADITCSVSQTIKVPHTVTNDRILDMATSPSYESSMTYRKVPCRCQVDGIDMVGDAWCYITDCDDEAYEIVITFGLMQDLGTWLENKPSLRDLNPYGQQKDELTNETDCITWNTASGVSLWASYYESKYDSSLKSMYFGLYDCGVSNRQYCNIHPWVSLREIYERIIDENNLAFTMPGNILEQMETLGIILTSNNTKVLANVNQSVYVRGLRQVGRVENVEQYFSLIFAESDYYHSTLPLSSIPVTHMLTPNEWNSMGFITTGDGDVTIRGDGYGYFIVRGLAEWEQGAPAILYGNTTYYDYFANWDDGDMVIYYPLPDGTYGTASASRPSGADYVRFAIPTIHADQAKAIIGQIIFKFNCEVDGKQVMFNSRGIIIEDVLNTEIVHALRYTYQQSQETYNTASPGGVFNLVENLPDISQIDFIKALCQMFGMFPIATSNGNVQFIPFYTITDKLAAGNVYDWSDKLIDTGKFSAGRIEFNLNNYAKRNIVTYKPDDRDVRPFTPQGELVVEDELLDAEKTLIEFPWSASSTYNNNLFIKQYKYNEEGNGVEFIELNYRLAAMKGITGDASDGSTEKKVSFPRWLWSSNLLLMYYAEYQAIIRRPKVITERIRLNEDDIRAIDYTKPVYLEKYGRYFAVKSVQWSSDSEESKVELIIIK